MPPGDRRRLLAAINGMALDPLAGDVRKLQGRANEFRRRVGACRILFAVDPEARRVDIVAVLRRTSTTY